MYAKTYFKSGDHNQECAECGFTFKSSQLRKRWDGYWVCAQDWEPKPKDQMKLRTPHGDRPVKNINKSSKDAMEADYDSDDHTLVFSD